MHFSKLSTDHNSMPIISIHFTFDYVKMGCPNTLDYSKWHHASWTSLHSNCCLLTKTENVKLEKGIFLYAGNK